MKKILIIDFSPAAGGPNDLLVQIKYSHLLFPQKYEYIVVGAKNSILEKNQSKYKYTFYGFDTNEKVWELWSYPERVPILWLNLIIKISKIIFTHKIDLIHCTLYYWAGVAIPLALLHRKKLILHFRDVKLIPSKLVRGLLRIATNTTFISVSHFVEYCFTEKFNIVKNRPHQVIYDPIDQAVFSTPASSQLKQKLIRKHRQSKKEIVMFTRVVKERGIDIAIEVAALITRKYPDVTFTHYGYEWFCDQEYYQKLKTLINDLHLSQHFHLKKYVYSRKKIARIYDQAFLSILPATEFALPNCAMESQYLGVPVVGNNVDGIPEVIGDQSHLLIKHNSIALYVDAIEKLLEDEGLYVQTGLTVAQHTQQTFDVETVVRQVDQVYEQIIQQ